MGRWFLQGTFSDATTLQEIPLRYGPQILGRDKQLSYAINSPTVSRNHARIEPRDHQFLLTDLGSSNGTFVNHQRITRPTLVDHGDIIHLGPHELRLIYRASRQSTLLPGNSTRIMNTAKLDARFPSGIKELQQLIDTSAVNIVFQPIRRASDLACTGYEALCRGTHSGLPSSPLELFTIAESFNLATALSEMLRREALASAAKHQLQGDLLLNTHPAELQNPTRLIASLAQLRQGHPERGITLEIHERAMTDDDNLLSKLKDELHQLEIKLAFDDFGVGQSRLMEMIEAKPDLIKFDKKLIENIDSADSSRIQLVKSLLSFAKTLQITTLAECVCNEAEYQTCNALGFEYYQGYHFGKPQPPGFFTPQAG